MISLRLLALYARSKAGPDPFEASGVKVRGLSFIIGIIESCLVPLGDLRRYAKIPGAPAFFRMFSYDIVLFFLIIARIVFYVMIAVKLCKAVSCLIKKLLNAHS